MLLRLLALGLFCEVARGKSPHIVFILADDLGWNDVSFHGSNQIPTPRLDALAKAGTELNNYYVNPVCSPTRATLMTGRSAMHTGIQTPYGAGDDASGLNLTYTLLPQQLKEMFNYTSYMVGKWHLGEKTPEYLPSSRGFNKYFGYYLGCTDYWKHYSDGGAAAAENGVDIHEGGAGLGLQPGQDRAVYNSSGTYSTQLYAEMAATYIKDHDPDTPMFLYLALQGAHSANNKFVQAPQALIQRFDGKISPVEETCGQWQHLGDGNCTQRAARKTIAATVTAIDDAVGTVVDTLRQTGMFKDTLLVFSTDNGGPTAGTNSNMMNNFPLRSGKGETWEGGIRATGLAAGWGLDEVAGTRSEKMHHVSDWFKTFLAAAAAGAGEAPAPPPKMASGETPFLFGDGLDNWKALTRPDVPSARNEILIAQQAPGSKLGAHAIRVGDMKLMWHPSLLYDMPSWYTPPTLPWNYSSTLIVKCGEPPSSTKGNLCETEATPCLYNITADPCEHHNLASEHPKIVKQLKERLELYKPHTVLTWVNFEDKNPVALPSNFGPTTPIKPDPQPHDGPHQYNGVWQPWLSAEQDKHHYPTNYKGPGYPVKREL